mgnify:CR=1 FL=1
MTDVEKKPCCAAAPAEKDAAPSCCRHKDRTPEEYRALVNRLSRIEGQVRGIRAMVEKDVYCTDILVQVAAVNAALNGFSKELLGQHVRTCVADDLRNGSSEKLDELLTLLNQLDQVTPLLPETLAAMRHIVNADPKKIFSFTLGDAGRRQLAHVCEDYTATQLERGFASLDYWKKVKD